MLLRTGIGVIMFMITCTATVFAARDVPQDTPRDTALQTLEDKASKGKLIYDYYCYQCHGYAGDGKTLASTYLSPQPRNFTASSPQELSIERMTTAVRDGRDGTAMVSFSSVLSQSNIDNVVTYIRQRFMTDSKPDYIYHTEENGWVDHQRYQLAFPYATGELPLDTPWEQLSEAQRAGKKLFMHSCISCHDRAVVREEGPAWELRPLSFPRKNYDHKSPLDSISSASPYQLHEQVPDTSGMSEQQQRGARLFQQNCAFCHGADASGRNWIGSFLQPQARDLSSDEIVARQQQELLQVIKNGLPGTSMPAWKHVLNNEQIQDVISYLKRNQHND